ncbi:MAG: 50S ribosomal protein L18 [Patescibacteria group bacterium]|jgi:large subunit ribosomal protein L18
MKDKSTEKNRKRIARVRRIRAVIHGTAVRPRVAVFRSARHISVQLIDDEKGKTLVSSSDLTVKKTKNIKKIEIAFSVGKKAGELAVAKKITKIVFDRRGYKYHGRVKALADGMRESGLKF